MSASRIIWIFSCALLILLLRPAAAEAEQATYLTEVYSGTVLYEQNAYTPLPPASTTKILTALLCLDLYPELESEHSIRPEAAAVGESSMNLRAGERLTLHQLLQGALVHSANDACYAIAQICAGGEPFFVHWMNIKAAVLGAETVTVCNTNGLPDEKHLVSAADLVVITRYALQNELFREIVASRSVEICSGDSYRYYRNTNRLLGIDEHIIGVKTGTTDAAGKCLVSAYEDGAAVYIAVVLDSADRFGESYGLLSQAAQENLLLRFPCRGEPLCAVSDGAGWLRLQAERDLNVLLPEDDLAGLRLRWYLREDSGSLALVNSMGKVLAEINLLPVE